MNLIHVGNIFGSVKDKIIITCHLRYLLEKVILSILFSYSNIWIFFTIRKFSDFNVISEIYLQN